jgi:S1-C subfamily serine protease
MRMERKDVLNSMWERGVQIDVVCGEDEWSGSGVIVGTGEIWTAGHVLDCPVVPELTVTLMKDGSVLPGVTAMVHETLDFGVLVAGVVADPIEMAPMPEAGGVVCILPALPRRVHQCGEVQLTSTREGGDNNLVWNGVVFFGNSGSGIYDLQGRLVGITTQMIPLPSGQVVGARGVSVVENGLHPVN